MTFLTSEVREKIQGAFIPSDAITAQSDHFLASCTELKIRRVFETVGFYPIVSKNRLNGKYAFTIVPYRMSGPLSRAPGFHAQYFEKKQIERLLGTKIYQGGQGSGYEDRWAKVNASRAFVSASLNRGLSEVLSRYINGSGPLIEIGAAKGYKVPQNAIRTQVDSVDCHHLHQSGFSPIYQMDIEELYSRLRDGGKKIPLFFALNVFDVLSSETRKSSLARLSLLQNADDHLVFMLDTNPEIRSTITQIRSLYPEHTPVHYVPPGSGCSKSSVILVPSENLEYRFNKIEDFAASMRAVEKEKQLKLQKLQQEQNLTVIALEDFYVEQMKRDLEEVGYDVDSYYHTAFVVGDVPEGVPATPQQNFVYKPVTEVGNMRKTPLTESDTVDSWAKKGLTFPEQFNNKEFLSEMRAKGQKIFGAEMLVIAAQKR